MKHGRRPGTHRRRSDRGAALLAAMLTVTMVATLAASALWQQWRDVEIETSERARVQAGWMLGGALDWSRLILREDYRANANSRVQTDNLTEPWAVPLQEARLSSFLAADQNNTSDGTEDNDVFLSGGITDAQASFNLRNLVTDRGELDVNSLEALQRLCSQLNLPEQQAQLIARGMASAIAGTAEAPLVPQRLDEIAWFGVPLSTIQALAPYADILPMRTPVNVNTAPVPVLAAVLGTSASVAQKLVTARTNKPFSDLTEVQQAAGVELVVENDRQSIFSRFFKVRGRLRLQQAAIEEQSLVSRDGTRVRAEWRERGALGLATQPMATR